jgi:hypothetical protein
VADADTVIQSVFEALGKDKDCGNAVDALRALYEAGGWDGEKIVAAIRRGLDEAEGN